LEFYSISLNRKEIQRVVLIPLMPKISFDAYLHIPVSKAEEEPSDMVRILSEMEKCTSNINFDG
jgi:hypothetical protein